MTVDRKLSIHPYFDSVKKRLFDLVFAVLGIILSLPLTLLIALLTKLTSSGPIIFKQHRIGKSGKPFTIWKFRTMREGAEREQKRYQRLNTSPFPTFKAVNDPRYVGIGRFLSQSGLDELPQLVNVLKGNMSLVGPRPFPVAENQELPNFWKFRTQVKPGIFSPAILVERREMTAKRWAKLDRQLLSNGGWVYDGRIVTQAIGQILGIHG